MNGIEKKQAVKGDHVFYRTRARILPKIHRAEGVYYYDETGKRILDGSGGPMVVNIGHGVKEVIDAMYEQMKKVVFAYNEHFVTDAQIKLSEKVINLAQRGMSKAYFVSGGSEGIEVAIKFIRQYHLERGNPGKIKLISRRPGYHGGTTGALSISGLPGRQKDYVPYLWNFPQIPAPTCNRCYFDLNYPTCNLRCAWELEKVVIKEKVETVGAFITEPIIGSTVTALTPPPEYYGIIRSICDRYDLLFMLDEVVTGFGRTGRNFGIHHWDVPADLMVVGKGATSGYAPLGGVLVHERVADVLLNSPRKTFFMGYTYSGNPLSCAAGLAVQEYIEKNNLIKRSQELGTYALDSLRKLEALDIVGEIRGKGLLLGVEFVQEKKGGKPFPPPKNVAGRIYNSCFEKGLLILPGKGAFDGVNGDHITVSPPFIIEKSQIDELTAILRESILELQNQI